MSVKPVGPRRTRRRLGQLAGRLQIELLEARELPSVTSWPGLLNPVIDAEPNDTLDHFQDLGNLSATGRGEAAGTIGQGSAGAADVDWYRFTLTQPASVTLTTLDKQGGSSLVSVLSLYNHDVFDYGDPYDPPGHRLLAQDDGIAHGGDARLQRNLGPGTYYVAVSGSGDNYFHPFLAGSGYPGSTGNFGLLVTAASLGFGPADGPAVLASDPAANAVLDHSPLILRLDFSAPLDTTKFQVGTNIRLIFNPHGTFGDGSDQDVGLSGTNFSPDLSMGQQPSTANELQLLLPSGLTPGYYKVFLAGDTTKGLPVLKDMNGIPLGTNASHLLGADVTITFQVNGIEGNTAVGAQSDDTPATAKQLGDVTNAGFLQLAGAIGNDPAYSPINPNPFLANPAAQVDLYHFRITGSGRYAFGAEVFAGRIGSPLDPGLTLFQLNPTDQKLYLVDVNDNTGNNSQASDGTVPLYTDPALLDGLTAGDYYLAVSGTTNLPNAGLGQLPGTNGIFDPSVTHSGQNGFTTGNYVLNLVVQADTQPPKVVSTTPAAGATLTAPPIRLTVQFNQPVNLQQLAYLAAQQSSTATLSAVYVLGADGVKYYPRSESYRLDTNQATFLMLDGLPNGVNKLHLSGSLGITDLAGSPLVGNDPSGDYVVSFTINGAPRGTNGNPLLWTDQEPNNSRSQPQVLGVLFPHELATGVKVVRDFTNNPSSAPADTDDYYQFQVLQNRTYAFNLSGSGLPSGTQPTLFDATGQPIPLLYVGNGSLGLVTLNPGTYVVHVGGWTAAQAANVKYQLQITINSGAEDPTPLTIGPAPLLHIRLVSLPPPPPPPAPPPVPPPPPTQVTVSTPPTSSPPPVASSSPPPVASSTSPPSSPAVMGPDPSPSSATVSLAVHTTAAAAPQNITGQVPRSTDIPSDVLATLASGPVGGVRGPTLNVVPSRSEQFLVQGVEPTLVEGLLRITVLTPMPSSGEASRPVNSISIKVGILGGPRLVVVVAESVRAMATICNQGVDNFFSRTWLLEYLKNWLNQLPSPNTEPESKDPAGSTDEQFEGSEGSGSAVPNPVTDDSQSSLSTDWTWTNGVLALGAFAAVNPRKRRLTRRAGTPRRKEPGSWNTE